MLVGPYVVVGTKWGLAACKASANLCVLSGPRVGQGESRKAKTLVGLLQRAFPRGLADPQHLQSSPMTNGQLSPVTEPKCWLSWSWKSSFWSRRRCRSAWSWRRRLPGCPRCHTSHTRLPETAKNSGHESPDSKPVTGPPLRMPG